MPHHWKSDTVQEGRRGVRVELVDEGRQFANFHKAGMLSTSGCEGSVRPNLLVPIATDEQERGADVKGGESSVEDEEAERSKASDFRGIEGASGDAPSIPHLVCRMCGWQGEG